MKDCIGVVTGRVYPEHVFIQLASSPDPICATCAKWKSELEEPSKTPATDDDGTMEEVGL